MENKKEIVVPASEVLEELGEILKRNQVELETPLEFALKDFIARYGRQMAARLLAYARYLDENSLYFANLVRDLGGLATTGERLLACQLRCDTFAPAKKMEEVAP